MNFRPFNPPARLTNAHLQSLLASSGLRRRLIQRRHDALFLAAEPVLLECGEGVRLLGMHSPAAAQAKALVVLMHGWEGSVDSTYILHATGRLHDAGFDVFRLNFRDHGDTHHLNEGLFHSCMIDEVVGAVAAIAERYPDRVLMLAGFSLGGNFTLRTALRAPARGIALRHAIAVSPVISPPHGLKAIEDAPWIYQTYFLRKWRRSLRKKQAIYDHYHGIDAWMDEDLRDMTRGLVETYTDFETVDDYLDGYSIAGDRLSGLQLPVTIVTAADDPVIPVDHFHELQLPPTAELMISDHGGHCGFIESYRLGSWISDLLADRFERALTEAGAPTPIEETVTC
jgi:predicted alpha/beta-fold hydrolase